jgi:hypothetical protein
MSNTGWPSPVRHDERMPHMNKSLILCVTIASLVAALPLGAQLEDDGSCSHEGGHYPEGTYRLTAKATDDNGAVRTSASVRIRIAGPK